MRGIVKTFPGVRALDGGDLDVAAGEPVTQGASSAISPARRVAQNKGMGDLVEHEVPSSIALRSTTITKDNVATYLPLGFES